MMFPSLINKELLIKHMLLLENNQRWEVTALHFASHHPIFDLFPKTAHTVMFHYIHTVTHLTYKHDTSDTT